MNDSFWGLDIKGFKEFLVSRRVIPEKRIPSHPYWVRRFQKFANKKSGEDFSEEM